MYKLQDIMTFFNLSERTIRRHLQQGILKGTKIKGTWFFTEEDIKHYMKNDISLKQINKAHQSNLQDFINGFKTESSCLVLDLKNISNHQLKEISLYMEKLDDPFKFNALKHKNHVRVIFIGSLTDTITVASHIKDKHYE